MGKIFVRERRRVRRGARRPRFAIVATQGTDLKVFQSHVRRAELEKIAADLGAEIVHLPRCEQAGEQEDDACRGHGRKRRKRGRSDG
jgi:hypothetical protein